MADDLETYLHRELRRAASAIEVPAPPPAHLSIVRGRGQVCATRRELVLALLILAVFLASALL